MRNNKHSDIRETARPAVFIPYAQDENLASLNWYVRARGPQSAVMSQVRRLVQSMDAGIPVYDVNTMEAKLDDSMYTDRMVAALSSAFGLLATVLAALSVYGVVAYSVGRRTNKIGIRIALGALGKDVVWLVMKEVAVLAAAGAALGLAIALAGSRLAEAQLYGVRSRDPLVYGGAVAALALVALLAAWLPARRAARISPTQALRYE
ncbi:MAG: FtsX-like permease family protein [Acidobacteria bacterium]|nr:FtsX-like permease family protein [Acidobacteriota bacterium]